MGTHAYVEWEHADSTCALLTRLREAGCVVVGLETVKGCPSIYQFSFPDELLRGERKEELAEGERNGEEEESVGGKQGGGVERLDGNCSKAKEREVAAVEGGRPMVVVVGNERYGIGEDVLSLCHHIARIPCRGYKNSLNVAVAFSVCAFEILRQFLHDSDAHRDEPTGHNDVHAANG